MARRGLSIDYATGQDGDYVHHVEIDMGSRKLFWGHDSGNSELHRCYCICSPTCTYPDRRMGLDLNIANLADDVVFFLCVQMYFDDKASAID